MPTIEEIEASLLAQFDRVNAGAPVNKTVKEMTIKAAAKRVLAGEIATVTKQGNWVSVSFSTPSR